MKRYIILQGNQLYTRGVLSLTENCVLASLFGMPGKAKILLFHTSSPDAPFFLGYASNGQTEFFLNQAVSYDSCVVLCKQAICLYGTCAKTAPDWHSVVSPLLEEQKNPSDTWKKFTWKRYVANHYPDEAPIVLCIFNHPATLKKSMRFRIIFMEQTEIKFVSHCPVRLAKVIHSPI